VSTRIVAQSRLPGLVQRRPIDRRTRPIDVGVPAEPVVAAREPDLCEPLRGLLLDREAHEPLVVSARELRHLGVPDQLPPFSLLALAGHRANLPDVSSVPR
jgi:hypothetical protein